jgi:hypothetical protein
MGIQITVSAGTDAASSSISASGSLQHVITNDEVASFGITDAALKSAIQTYFGQAPNDAYLHSNTPWGDLYTTYGWPQVQTVMNLTSATITGITSNPSVIATNTFANNSGVAGTFTCGVSTSIANTESTTWTESSTVSFSESVNFKVTFAGLGEAGGSVTWGFSETFGRSDTQSQTITVGSTSGVTVTLQPGQSVQANLNSSRGVMNIRVVYQAYLIGDTAINYNPTFNGHHFYALPIASVMAAAGISNSITVTQDIQIGYYSDASVTLTDPHGKSVSCIQAKVGAS